MDKIKLKNKLEDKLKTLEIDYKELLKDPSMRDACFTSAGCNNRAIQHKLTSYRNKIGVYGNKIDAIKLALRIVTNETFIHNDILEIYNNFLQLRNPEIYYDICTECLTFNSIKNVINLVIDLFLPICKKQILNLELVFANSHGYKYNIPLN